MYSYLCFSFLCCHHLCCHHLCCKFEYRSWRGVLDTTLCDKVCEWLATIRWFSSSAPVSSNNKTDRHDITEILLNVTLKTITPPFYIVSGIA